MGRWISTLLLSFIMLGACTSTVKNTIKNDAQNLLPSIVLIEARHEKITVNVKGEGEVHLIRTRGSGTIVQRSFEKDHYVYHVLSCGHLYMPMPGYKITVTLVMFNEEGWNEAQKIKADSFWSYENKGYDTSLVKFKSKQFFPIVPLAKKVPRNLIGRRAMIMGCPFGNVPMIAYGHFGVNCPVSELGENYVEMTMFVAPGNSGSGAYLFNEEKKRWELMGIITHGYGGARFAMAAIALRLDAIRTLLKRYGLSYAIGY